MLEMVTGYLLPLNCTCSIPSKPQRMKETYEIQEATGRVGKNVSNASDHKTALSTSMLSFGLLTEPHVLNVDDKASSQVEDGEQGVAHEG